MIEWYEIAALAGVIGACIWGTVRKKKAQGATRQSYRPEPFDKRLEN